MKNIIDDYCEFPIALRKPMWKIWHKLLIRFDKSASVNFMNYGYHRLNGEEPLHLEEHDEINRYCIQLYDHVVQSVPLTGKKVLEVGSGRGGGASYISRYYKPAKYTGVDIQSGVVDFCNNFYKVPNLAFLKGEAEKLPLEKNSYDAIVNVESARCYSSIETFFSEANRVLKPNGHFLFADMIEGTDVENIRKKLVQAGFEIHSEQNITKNVAEGLLLDSKRREQLITENIPRFLHKNFKKFAGTEGTTRFNSFTDGTYEYRSFVLRKN